MHLVPEPRYPVCPECHENLTTPDSLQACPGCGLTFTAAPASLAPARLKRIAEILDGQPIYGNEWEPPSSPDKYLAVEYSDGDAVWAYGDDSIEELKAAIVISETDRNMVKVYDLDTEVVYLPVWTLSHFVQQS